MDTIYNNVALVEFSDEATVEEIRPLLEKYIVRALSKTVFVVDHQRNEELIKLLKKRGYEPRLSEVGQSK